MNSRLTVYNGEMYQLPYDGKELVLDKITEAIQKLGALEDIEERLYKYKDIGVDDLITLFNKLTEEDIEYFIQLIFKRRKIL